MQQLMYDILCDLILGGMQVPPGPDTDVDADADADTGTAERSPSAESAPPAGPVDDDDLPINHDWLPTGPPPAAGGDARDDQPPDGEPVDLMAAYRTRPPAGLLEPDGVDPPPAPGSPFWAGRRIPPNITLHADGSFTPAEPHQRIGDPRVPNRKVITAEILVTVPAATACGAADAPGRLAGWGSLPAAEVRRLVAAARHWTRVETDPIDDAILGFDSEQRTIPTALRRLIQARSGTCDEPGCTTGAHRADIDHVIRFEHGGRTIEINLSALCRPAHQTKDDGYLHVQRTPHGLQWASKWGATRLKKNQMPIRRRPTPTATATDEPAPF